MVRKNIELCNTNWPTTWQIFQQFQDTDRYSAVWTSGHIESKFLVDKAIAVQVDASDNAFETYTGGVRFESRLRIVCPTIFVDFCLYLQKHCSTFYYTRPPFVSTVR
jgi:hypothetical protein